MKKIKDPRKYFYARNGTTIKSLKEAPSVLAKMPKDVYNYHVNPSKNDFSNWVRDVLKMPSLANRIQHAKRQEMINKIKRFLKSRKVKKGNKKNKRRKRKTKKSSLDMDKLKKSFKKKFDEIMLS